MGRVSIKFKPGDSHMLENSEGPYSEDKRRRAERRWKRREQLILNEGLKHKCFASATRITVKSCGNSTFLTDNNDHMVEEDEVDEEYKMFLDTYGSHIDVESNNNDDVSNIDVDTVYICDNDDDSDPQYKMFLENLRKEGNSYISSVSVHNQLVDIRYEGEEEEEEEEEEKEEEEEEQAGDAVEPQQNLETERRPFNKRTGSDVSGVPENTCNTELEFDNVDEDYQIFLNLCRIDDGSLVYEVGNELKGKSSSVNNNSQVSDHAFDNPKVQCDIDEEEQTGDPVESQQNLVTERGPFNRRPWSEVSILPKNNCNTELELDNEYQIFLKSRRMVGSELKGRSSSVRNNSQGSDQAFNTPEAQCDIDKEERIGDLVESQQSLETERGPCNKRPRLDVSSASMNNCNTELEVDSADEDYQKFLDSYTVDDDGLMFARLGSDLKGKSSSVRYNSRVSDQAFDTPKSQCDVDEDYQLFLNSMILDGNLVHMQDRNITKTYKGDGGSSSSEPDLILLEPNQMDENTPFIFSKTYHSSWFENETNPRDSRHFSSNDHSEFRRRLMKDLERPYNQEEHDQFLHEVHHQRQKERHAETRQGVVKSYRIEGVNKSYLELYPDLAKAIAGFKEPHKVLFLLRGFFFWLQNLTREERFRPWTDKSCLEILQKM